MACPEFVTAFEAAAPALSAWAHLRCRGPLGSFVSEDDLTQEVALAAWRARERFDPARGPFRPWLFGVASLVAADLLRRRGRAELPDAGALADGVVADMTTISRRARRREALEQLFVELDGLDAADRDLVVHRGLEGLPHADVAGLLGLSVEAATKRWQRLRERILSWPAAHDLLGEH